MTKRFQKVCREAIAEGIVLLENKEMSLPLTSQDKVAIFGRAQFEYVKSGNGSGGRVRCPYVTQICPELEKRVIVDQKVKAFYVNYRQENPYHPGDEYQYASLKNPYLAESIVEEAAFNNDKAIYVIHRVCGEGIDAKAEKGNWYLSDEEAQNLEILSKYFKHLIVLINSGNVIDMSFVNKYHIPTVAYIWQGGQEGAVGTVDALMNDRPISGHLADTIAKDINDYPATKYFLHKDKNIHVEDIYVGYRYFETFAQDKVLYPFGYGLSYTNFDVKFVGARKVKNTIYLKVNVTNIGDYDGKEVVQAYYATPNNLIKTPKKQLIAFGKTKLLKPNEKDTISLKVNISDLASYDDEMLTNYPFSYVLEKGEYKLYLGTNVRDSFECYSFKVADNLCVRKCEQALAPQEDFEMLCERDGKLAYKHAFLSRKSCYDKMKHIDKAIKTGDYNLTDCYNGKCTLDEFIACLSDDDLCHIVKGEGMSSPKATYNGTASCFGGITNQLKKVDVPLITCCDGPSGVRMENYISMTCIPTGCLLSASYNPKSLKTMFKEFAEEMKAYNVDVILGPGINIHRHPLGGRNFEYFSEDPYLTGVFARDIAMYFKTSGVDSTIKHFFANAQETNRHEENEVMSERAAREIFLKPFEMAVRSGYTKAIMSSYNRVNGISTAGNYDLTTIILRNEWGYDGIVMTDWWTNIDDPIKNTFNKYNLATMIKAQNDVYMVVPDTMSYHDDLKEALSNGYLSRGELERCVKNILNFSMQTPAFKRIIIGDKSEEFADFNNYVLVKSCPVIEEETRIDWAKSFYHVDLNNDSSGSYFAEIEYIIDKTELDQITVIVALNDMLEAISLVLNGSNGNKAVSRFPFFVNEKARLSFINDEIKVKSFKLFKKKD